VSIGHAVIGPAGWRPTQKGVLESDCKSPGKEGTGLPGLWVAMLLKATEHWFFHYHET
jgi:hypothetical protein